jgi:hypothetical protein
MSEFIDLTCYEEVEVTTEEEEEVNEYSGPESGVDYFSEGYLSDYPEPDLDDGVDYSFEEGSVGSSRPWVEYALYDEDCPIYLEEFIEEDWMRSTS